MLQKTSYKVPAATYAPNQWDTMLDWAARLLAIAAAYLVMQFITFIIKRRRDHKTFERMHMPGPKPHLIHGHLYETRRQAYVKFAHKMHEKYGKTVGMYLGGDPYLMTKDLDLIQQVFVSKSRLFFNRMFFYLNIDPVPDNLICQRGDRWRYMRRLLTPAFTNSKIRSSHFYFDAEQTVRRFMKQLDQNATESNTIRETVVDDSYDRMAAVALDVIVKTAFHMDNVISFDGPVTEPIERQLKRGKVSEEGCQRGPSLARNKDTFLETVKRACRLGFNPLVELIFCFPFLDKPLTFLCNQLYLARIVQVLFDRLDYLVKRQQPGDENDDNPVGQGQHKSDLNGANSPPLSQRRRIIDSLIEVLRERKITRSEFTGNAFVIVFAGFETTANALTFTLWLLAKHPDVQAKLRQELREKMSKIIVSSTATAGVGSKPSDNHKQLEAELAELATGCDYLEMVINESLRLYPPVPGLSCRQASVDCTLNNGVRVERGVNVIPSVFSIHRDKTIWGESAQEFRPERFEVLTMAHLNSAMFMPFGLGPRNCIGKGVAMHEMKIVIGRLVSAYSIQPVAGKTPEKLKLCSPINITITSAEKICLKFVKLNTL